MKRIVKTTASGVKLVQLIPERPQDIALLRIMQRERVIKSPLKRAKEAGHGR